MKLLKYLKYIFLTWLVLTLIVCVGGIINYRINLNSYLNEEVPKEHFSGKKTAPDSTEVYVVGSVHFETEHVKRDDIYQYINRISPDVILYESDPKTTDRMVNKTDFYSQVMSAFSKKNQVARFVTLKYLDKHPETRVFGYEWWERDLYHQKYDLPDNSSKLLNLALSLKQKNVLSAKESALIDQYVAINKKFRDLGNPKTVYDINNSRTDSIIRLRQRYVYTLVPEILREGKEVGALKDFIPIHMSYWDLRNESMTENILKQIHHHPNERIVVLTGYSHRYYLLDELKKYEAEYHFTLK